MVLRRRDLENFRAVMNPFLQQIQQLWNRQSFLGRVVLGGATAILVLIVAGVGFWSSQTSYAVLFSGLPMEEAAAITHKLDADRVTYKLSADGTTILVPTEGVQKTRMNLAVAGLLKGNEKGFELLEDTPIGATPFQLEVNYARAIQGELARTIMTLDSVAHARVHIVQPDSSPFVREERPVTASVVLKMRPGATLNRPAVQGMVALVAASVKGLTSENVTILDTEGRMLSEKKRSTQGQASSDQLAHQLEVESHLAEKAQEVLTKLLGPDRAVVRVTLDMSFRHVKENSEKFDPDGKVVVHESVQSSKTTAPGGPRGPAGTASNLPPGAPPVGPAVAGPSANEEVIDSQYLVSRNNLIQEEQQEIINRLTVAVMLIPPIPVDEMPLEESLGITPAKAESLVKQAVGFKEGRDKIEVGIGKPVESPAEKALDQQLLAVQNWQSYGNVAKASSLGIAALALLAIGVMSIRSKSAPDPKGALASGGMTAAELNDLHAVAGTIKAWLEEPATIRMDRPKPTATAAGR